MDFLGQTLTFAASEYDFGTAQSVIEREANVMLNYSHDPANFYNAWKRYYQLIFRDNYSRLDGVYNSIAPFFKNREYSDYEKSGNSYVLASDF